MLNSFGTEKAILKFCRPHLRTWWYKRRAMLQYSPLPPSSCRLLYFIFYFAVLSQQDNYDQLSSLGQKYPNFHHSKQFIFIFQTHDIVINSWKVARSLQMKVWHLRVSFIWLYEAQSTRPHFPVSSFSTLSQQLIDSSWLPK